MKIKTLVNVTILAIFIAGSSTVNAQSDNSCISVTQTLRLGSRQPASEITKIQKYLVDNKYLDTTPTGYFGKLTENAIKKFQKDNGIQTTGIIGPLTRAKLQELVCKVVAVNTTVKPTQETISNPNLASAIVASQVAVPESSNVSDSKMLLPFTSSDFSTWKKSWGDLVVTTGNLSLSASSDSTEAIATFPSSNSLANYAYTANVFVKRGMIVTIARYVDDNNYLGCVFSGKNIDIIQNLNGVQETVASGYLEDSPFSYFFFVSQNVTMTVKDNTVGCRQIGNEDSVVFKNVDQSLLKGGVGIKTWNDVPGTASLDLSKVILEKI